MWSSAVSAEVPWIADQTSCQAIASRLDSFQSIVRSGNKLSERQRGELSVLLHEACGSRFANCSIPICKSLAARATKVERIPGTDISQPVKSDPPLAWLNKDLNCQQLLNEVRNRYQSLGKFSELSDSKRVELGYVLDVVCSERFAECSFKQCARDLPQIDPMEAKIADRLALEAERLAHKDIQNLAAAPDTLGDAGTHKSAASVPAVAVATPTILEPDSPPPADAIGNKVDGEQAQTLEDRAVQAAIVEYEALVREDAATRGAMVEIAMDDEKKSRKSWNRIGNPDELAVVEERRKRSKESDDDDRSYGARSQSPGSNSQRKKAPGVKAPGVKGAGANPSGGLKNSKGSNSAGKKSGKPSVGKKPGTAVDPIVY